MKISRNQVSSIIVAIILVLLGLLSLVSRDSLDYIMATDHFVAPNNVGVTSQVAETNSLPLNIEIDALGVKVEVIKGYYNTVTQDWTLTKNAAQYAVISPQPNQQEGNTFIYGHARSVVFGKLPLLKVGDMATITTTDNKVFMYRFNHSYTVNPADNSVLKYSGPPILTLQTCSGIRYQNRTMYEFEFVGVKDV